jgi:hypothetical protein
MDFLLNSDVIYFYANFINIYFVQKLGPRVAKSLQKDEKQKCDMKLSEM